MDENALREALNRDICSLPSDIVFGHDARIKEYETSDDPMRRQAAANPPYLATIEEAYGGDRERFRADLGRSLALLGEADVEQERIDALEDGEARAEAALQACAFNPYARHYLMTRHSLRHVRHDRETALALLGSAYQTLLMNPRNPVAWLMGACAANLLGWHKEASHLMDLTTTDAVLGHGQPVLNYLGCREAVEAVAFAMEEHLREDRPGVVRGNEGPLDGLSRMGMALISFRSFAELTASDAGARRLDDTRRIVLQAAHDALKHWALRTGRIEADDSQG